MKKQPLGGRKQMDLENLNGLTGSEFIFEVEKRHIRQFAEAIGDLNPLYVDEEYLAKNVIWRHYCTTNLPYSNWTR